MPCTTMEMNNVEILVMNKTFNKLRLYCSLLANNDHKVKHVEHY